VNAPLQTGARRAGVEIDRVSGNDLTALVTDRGPAPMNIAALLVVDGGERLAHREVTRLLDERLGSVPRLRQRLRHAPPGFGRPYWVDDERFEIERHLHVDRVTDEAELMRLVAVVACTPLRRDRPLWAAHWVNGIGSDRAALVVVAHHVVADGIGGLAVLAALADHAGTERPSLAPAERHTDPSLPELAADVWRTRLQDLRRTTARARLARAGLHDLGVGRERPRLAPGTSLNRPTGPRRHLGRAELPLEDVVDAAHRHDCTVNDLVLAAVVGGVTDVLASRGERVDELVVSVPYSSRGTASPDRLGNRTGVVPFRVPAAGSTPVERLRSVASQSRAQRGRPRAASAAPLGLLFRGLARVGAFRLFIDHQRLVNTFVTNVRGPTAPLAFGGCAVSRIVPVAVTPGNTSVTFDVLSYAGCLGVTVVADPGAVADPAELADRLRTRLEELVAGS
jgi:WS/DGAT/MGAT family acyltransferase